MAYAAAGLATSSGGVMSTEGAIHYSGPVDYKFHGHRMSTITRHSFLLSFGARLWGGTAHTGFASADYAYFGVSGAKVSNSVRGVPGRFGVAGLPGRSLVSNGSFRASGASGVMQNGFCSYPDWRKRGTYYVGFRFNTGAGPQYGWVRIKWDGCPANYFIVKDYAWGDPGDQIKTGQKHLHEDETQVAPPSARSTEAAPRVDSKGSLGLLALGAAGLQAWRRFRSGGSDSEADAP